MKMAIAGFVAGSLMLLLVALSVWIAAAGFLVMTLSAVLAYRYAGRLGNDTVAPGTFGRIASRVAGRLRPPPPDPRSDDR
jgi:membrane protein implicated in regulation of membrane protease activity